jgi:hypothetical protein
LRRARLEENPNYVFAEAAVVESRMLIVPGAMAVHNGVIIVARPPRPDDEQQQQQQQ